MQTLNKVTLIGNVGKDPETQTLTDGAKVARVNVATTEKYKDKAGQTHSATDWHSVVMWRGLADLAEKYIKKGSLIYIEGKLKTRNYDNKEGQKVYVTEVLAENIILLDKKEE